MHKSTGHDAPRKGDKPLEWTQRRSPDPLFKLKVDPHFLAHLKKTAKNRQVSLSQYMRMVLSEHSNYEVPDEE